MSRIINVKPGDFSLTPFGQIAYSRLQALALDGLAGKQIRFSVMLQTCAYLYETGAVFGRACPGRIVGILESLHSQGYDHCDLDSLKWALKTRLENTSRECKSLYTFYLDLTMRNFNMDFSVWGMKKAHHELRTLNEIWEHLDHAGAEGLAMGRFFPDLTEALYNKRFDAENGIIREMKAHGVIAPDESKQPDIDKREQLVVEMFQS